LPALPLLATASQLASHLQQDVDTATAELRLAGASGKVRAYTKQKIHLVSDDTIELDGCQYEVVLPERPVVVDGSHVLTVVEVSSLGVASPALTINRDFMRRGQVLRRMAGAGWDALVGYPRGRWAPTVRVTYSHGYVTIPDEIVDVVLDVAARTYINPSALRSFTIDDYSETYAIENINAADLTAANKATLSEAGYRRRTGSARIR
jgi:hypothetical protein